MSVTIRDIAKAAGVSKATVSYVINGRPGVGQETRERVLAIMKQMNFQPNVSARALAGQSTEMLGLVIPDIADVFYASAIRGVESKANEFGYTLNLCTTHALPQREAEVVDMLTHGRVDGIILMTYFLDENYFSQLRARRVPFVSIGHPPALDSLYSISVDNEEAGYKATQYLIHLGHRRIGFLQGPQGSWDSAQRFAGYQRALREHGLSFRSDWVRCGEFRRLLGQAAARELLSLPEPPTAIFAANDQMALGALSAAAERNMRVPEDLSIIGVDDIEAASVVDPPLTTIRQPIQAMGARAVEVLLALIKGERPEPRQVSLPTELIVRGSCGPPSR